MKTVKNALKMLGLGSVLLVAPFAFAAQTAMFVFDSFTADTYAQCKAMGLAQTARSIQLTVDLSSIQSPTQGVPALTTISGISLANSPVFFFMGLKDEYAYMSRPVDAVVADKAYSGSNFSFVSKTQYIGYRGALRLNDADGRRCLMVLRQN
jgi:hypothetical protein